MIDVLSLMEQGKIKGGARLSFYIKPEQFDYVYNEKTETFVDINYSTIYVKHVLTKSFLRLEVSLEQPKYRIKLPNSKYYLAYVKRGYEEEFMPIIPCTPSDGLEIEKDVFKTGFTERDFIEIRKLQPYEQFKELIKDDEK